MEDSVMDLTSFNQNLDELKSTLKVHKAEMSGLQSELENLFSEHHDEVVKTSFEHLQNLISINHRAVMDQSNKLKAVKSRIEIETSEGMETLREEDLKILAENLEDEVKTTAKLCEEARGEFKSFASQYASA